MLAEFQRVMNSIFREFPSAQAFIDDFLGISKGSEIKILAKVEKFDEA